MDEDKEETEKLIDGMLGFLDDTSEDENCNEAAKFPKFPAGEIQNAETVDLNNALEGEPNQSNNGGVHHEKKLQWNKIKIPQCKKQKNPNANKQKEGTDNGSKPSKSKDRRNPNDYLREVQRAIYGDTTGHPAHGSEEYFNAAQNYALYGKDFLDFPKNLSDIFVESAKKPQEDAPNVTDATVTPPKSPTNVEEKKPGNEAETTTSAASASQCHWTNDIATIARPTASRASGYNVLSENRANYMSGQRPPALFLPARYSPNARNNLPHRLPPPPGLMYSNPMKTPYSQPYMNTSFMETQSLTSNTTQGPMMGRTTGLYERYIYSQMVQHHQQQMQHQNQQHADPGVAAAMPPDAHAQRRANSVRCLCLKRSCRKCALNEYRDRP